MIPWSLFLEAKGNYLVMTQSLAQMSFMYAGIDAIACGTNYDLHKGNKSIHIPAEAELILDKIYWRLNKAQEMLFMAAGHMFSQNDEIPCLHAIAFPIGEALSLKARLLNYWQNVEKEGNNTLIESVKKITKVILDPIQVLFPIPIYYYTMTVEQKAIADLVVKDSVEEYVQIIESGNLEKEFNPNYFLMTQSIARISFACTQTDILFNKSRIYPYKNNDAKQSCRQKFQIVGGNLIDLLEQSYALFAECKESYAHLVAVGLIDNILQQMMEILKTRLQGLKTSWNSALAIEREVIKTTEALFPIPSSHLTISPELNTFVIDSIQKDWKRYFYYLQKDWEGYLLYNN